MNFYSCGGPVNVNFGTDYPSDASGHVFWMENLSAEYGLPGCGPVILDDGCGLLDVIEPYDAVYAPAAGLRNVDADTNQVIDLRDLSYFQEAFVGTRPIYYGDFSRDDIVALVDLGLFQAHFTTCSGGFRGAEDRLRVDGTAAASPNTDVRVYLHITEALPSGSPPPLILPHQAVTSVPSVGPGGRDMTILLYAIDYVGISGVHVRCRWPDEWTFLRLDPSLLPGQLLGYPDERLHERAYAAAFDCITGGGPRALSRFDVHVNRPGTVSFDTVNMLLEILDCQGQVKSLGVAAESTVVGQPSEREGKRAPRLMRLSPDASPFGAEFQLLAEEPVSLSAHVYHVSGRLVRVLEEGRTVRGTHSIGWDGTAENGLRVPAGVYLIELCAGGVRFVERTLQLR